MDDIGDIEHLKTVNGLGIRVNGKVRLTAPERIVPHERMDQDLPGYAWDLLPFKEKPFDLYTDLQCGTLNMITIKELHLQQFIHLWDAHLNVAFV